MKGSIRVLLTVIMTLGLAFCPAGRIRPAAAETTVITLTIGNPNITVNGTPRPIDSSGTTPVIVAGRTLLPIRAVVEAIGGTIEWDATTRTVTIVAGAVTMGLTIGNRMATVNGARLPIDSQNATVVPLIVGGRTMLPVRFVGEQLGGTVEWDPATRTATLTFVAPAALMAPSLVEPADGALSTSTTITFRWTPVEGATSYSLSVSMGGTEVYRGTSTSNSFTPSSSILTAGQYSWTVTAVRGATTGPASLPRRFMVQLPMSAADIVKKATPSIAELLVQFPDGHKAEAAAFFIEPNGVLVTTYSAIRGTIDGSVVLADGTIREHPHVLGYSPSANVAILSVTSDQPMTALQMTQAQSAQLNQDAVMVGPVMVGPTISGMIQQTLVGVVNGVTPGGFTLRSAGLNAAEGAPVLNSFGEVLGMIPTDAPVSPGTYPAIFATTILGVARTGSWTLQEVTEREGTDPQALAAPSLSEPAAGSTVDNLTPLFRWTRVLYAAKYEFRLRKGGDPSGSSNVDAMVTVMSVTIKPGILVAGSSYVWAVRAGNDRGWGPWSTDRAFAVSSFITQPAAPVPLEPLNETVVNTSAPILCWQAVPNAAQYFIWVGASTGDTVYETSTDALSVIVPAGVLASGTAYSWSVRAENASDVSSLRSPEIVFTTAFPTGLGVPSLVSPAPLALIVALNPTFVWQAVPTATSYDIAVCEKTSSTTVVKVFEQAVSGTSLTMPAGVLRPGTIYSWTVIAGTAEGWSKTGDTWNWSLARSFTVATNAVAVLVPPVLMEPRDGATSGTLLPLLSWKSVMAASWYRVYIGKGTSEASLVEVLNKVVTPAAGDTQQYAVPLGTLEPGTTYYWRVYAGTGFDVVSSPFMHFTTP